MAKPEFIIIAPHADDEIIGCWELLHAKRVRMVVFPTEAIRQEALSTTLLFEHQVALYSDLQFTASDVIYMFPDHTYELHPEHRKYGAMGENLLREGLSNICFYSTNMNAPYIHVVQDPVAKLTALNYLYPNKKSLWEYDHKYYLFEGYTKWIMGWKDLS